MRIPPGDLAPTAHALSFRPRAVAALAAAFVLLTAARHSSRAVERIDFDRISRSRSPAFDARLAPVSDAGVKDFRIPIKDATIEIRAIRSALPPSTNRRCHTRSTFTRREFRRTSRIG